MNRSMACAPAHAAERVPAPEREGSGGSMIEEACTHYTEAHGLLVKLSKGDN